MIVSVSQHIRKCWLGYVQDMPLPKSNYLYSLYKEKNKRTQSIQNKNQKYFQFLFLVAQTKCL